MIDGWKNRKDALAAHDPACTLFGAAGHRWLSRPVPVAEVEAFERRNAVPLPAAYRAWITQVGVGAGPFYGFADLPGRTPRASAARFPSTKSTWMRSASRLASTPAMARSS
ncbi:MAG: SMI1/KNR4 family protein [bacterium]